MTSLAGRLRRLLKQTQARCAEKLVLLRDARLTITSTAAATQDYLNQLKAHDVQIVRPSETVLSGLKALGGLLSEAKSGDLAHEGQSVPPERVQPWLAKHLP